MRRWVSSVLGIIIICFASKVMAADRVVVLDGASVAAAVSLFPGESVSTRAETVGVADHLQTVDAVIFGPTRAVAATSLAASLLANGTTVAVLTPGRPAGPWPWQRMTGGWVARYDVVGPARLMDTSIYDAVDLRPVGRPAVMRRQVVLLATLFALAAIGATLLRRRAMWGVVSISLIASVGIIAWGRSRPTVVANRVNVVITTGPIEQVDEWTFQRSPVPADVKITGVEDGWPVPRSPWHAQRAHVTVTGPSATFHVDRELPMAILHRTLRPMTDDDRMYSLITPDLRRLLARYESADVSFIGMTHASDGTPTIWLNRSKD